MESTHADKRSCGADPRERRRGFAAERAQTGTAALDKLFEDYFERSLQLSPLQATFIGDHRYDDRLTNNISPAHVAEALATEKRFLEAALRFEGQNLSDEDRLSLEIFLSERRTSIAAAEFPGELLPINQFSSLPALMPVLGSGESAQPFATTQDYERFLRRMQDYVVWSDQAIVNMREGARKGVVNPRVLMEKTLPQLAGLIAETPEKSIFWQPLTRFPDAVSQVDRVASAGGVSPGDRDEHQPGVSAIARFHPR